MQSNSCNSWHGWMILCDCRAHSNAQLQRQSESEKNTAEVLQCHVNMWPKSFVLGWTLKPGETATTREISSTGGAPQTSLQGDGPFDKVTTCLDSSVHRRTAAGNQRRRHKREGTTVRTAAPSLKSRLSLIGQVV